jgi:hypothetical protein
MVLSPPSNVCKPSDASRATGADSVAAQPTQLDQLNGLQVRLPPCCQQQLPQVPIHATLVGSDCCEAEGISGRGYAPAFELCRKLVAAGFDPVSPLEAWRGETLSLRVRSIGEGAQFTVEDDRHGTPSTLAEPPAGVWRRLACRANCRRAGGSHPGAAGHTECRAMTVLSEHGTEWRSIDQFGPLLVECVVTVDEFDGRPVPPGFITDDTFWRLVKRLPGGRTRWRRIELLQPLTTPEAAP